MSGRTLNPNVRNPSVENITYFIDTAFSVLSLRKSPPTFINPRLIILIPWPVYYASRDCLKTSTPAGKYEGILENTGNTSTDFKRRKIYCRKGLEIFNIIILSYD